MIRIGQAAATVTAAIAIILIAGCVEPIAAPEFEDAVIPGLNDPDQKLRHPQLLQEATQLASKKGNVRIIISYWDPNINADGVLKRHGVLKRNGVLKRHGSDGLPTFLADAVEIDADEARKKYGLAQEENPIPRVLQDLIGDGDIFQIEPDFSIPALSGGDFASSPMNDFQTIPWNVEAVGAAVPRATEDELSEVDLYILDTPFDEADINLKGNKDYAHAGGPDTYTHGYLIAGIAAAENNDTGILGVAPSVRTHSYQVLSRDGFTSSSIAVEALLDIYEEKSMHPEKSIVVSISFGAYVGFDMPTVLDEAISHLVGIGIVVVVSAGNDGLDASLVSPAHADGAITVGAYDTNRVVPSFSNYGTNVDIHAPGVDVLSLGRIKKNTIELLIASGTSFSVPHVAGAAAIALAKHPEIARDANLSNRILEMISADCGLSGGQPGTTTACVSVANF